MPNQLFTCPPYIGPDCEKYDETITMQTYLEIYNRIENLALNIMRWDNLPDETMQLIIERCLFYYGNCVFFRDEVSGDYLTLPMCAQYAWDEYGIPVEYEVMGAMGYKKKLTRFNSVLMLNNYNFSPDVTMAAIFARRLTETKRTVDMHVEAHRIGKILAVPENKKQSAKKLLERIKGFRLWQIVMPGILNDLKEVHEINLETSYIIDKLDTHENELWRECYDYFGIDSTPEKAERVLTDEINVQTSVAEVNRNVRLNPRQDAVERINKMFGLSISCTANLDSIRGNGGDRVGGIHNDPKDSDGSSDRENE